MHAIIPDIATTSTSDTVKTINAILNESGCRDTEKDKETVRTNLNQLALDHFLN